ncbi:MAG: hypothetical protein DRJ52_02580 [Thermoprotei archaeon]|nr:MAG: hypothetical protein DRJ52_02580 [Thermoprotei archaeon]RLE99273.1 MAG: hypothetical protein DRJ63_05900 [Thermoprotei archaeon]
MPKVRKVKRRPLKRKVKKREKAMSSKHVVLIGAILYLLPLIALLLKPEFSEEEFLEKLLEMTASLAMLISIYIALKLEISKYYKRLISSKLLAMKAPSIEIPATPAETRVGAPLVKPAAAPTATREKPVAIVPASEEVRPKPPVASKKVCPYCGGELPLGDIHIFCPHCGRKLRD